MGEIYNFLITGVLILAAIVLTLTLLGFAFSFFVLKKFRNYLIEEKTNRIQSESVEGLSSEIIEKLSSMTWERLQELCKIIERCPHCPFCTQRLVKLIEEAMLIKTTKGDE